MKHRGRHRFRGSSLLETALLMPVLILLLVGTVEVAKITYIYYTLHKTLYTLARFVGTQQGANLCDAADATVAAAKGFALSGTTDQGGTPTLANLTAEMIDIRLERYSGDTQSLDTCDCSDVSCNQGTGGRGPDYIVVSIPDGYVVRPSIPYLTATEIPLRPLVRVPFGGT